jgi:dTMP kinase
VLCDRFSDSTFAYQGAGRGLPAASVAAADGLATGGRRPDLVVLFDLPAAEARARCTSPRRQARPAVDRLDQEDVAFHERVRQGFLARAGAEPDRFRTVDSTGSRQATAERVRELLAPLVAERRA